MSQTPFRLLLIVLGLVLAALIGGELLGSVTTLNSKGKLKSEFQFAFSMTGSSDDLLLVPAGKTLVVTDLLIRCVGPSSSEVGLRSNSNGITPFIRLTAGQTFAHTFVIGPEVDAGATFNILDFTASSNVSYFISGYLRK